MNFLILATTLFCRLANPEGTAVTYAPDWLAIPYSVTNVRHHAEWPTNIDESADAPIEPIREWQTTNIVERFRCELFPKREDYIAQGWFVNAITPARPGAGYHVSSVRYAVNGDSVVAVYGYEQDAPPTYRYSKLKLGDQLDRLGLYETAEAWMVSNRVFRQWRDAQFFEDGYPALVAATNLAVSAGLLTAEQMKKILEASRDE